jgi:predicted ATPase
LAFGWIFCGPHPSDDEEPAAVGAPFLVAREEEIGLLRRRWAQAKAGLGHVVLLGGEAGIGKSALVEALRADTRHKGVSRPAFRCSPYHQHSALFPIMTHLERRLHLTRDDVPATKLDKLERVLQGYHLPLAEIVPLFATLLPVALDGRYPAMQLTPQ